VSVEGSERGVEESEHTLDTDVDVVLRLLGVACVLIGLREGVWKGCELVPVVEGGWSSRAQGRKEDSQVCVTDEWCARCGGRRGERGAAHEENIPKERKFSIVDTVGRRVSWAKL
jgi:hypothetical protein